MATPNFPSIEDWTPPWGDGEFDADKARGLIYNLSKDKSQAEATVDHLRSQATKMKSDLAAAQAASKDAENVKTESEVLRDEAIYGRKVKAAIEKGIDPAKAGWLSGETPDELAKSAEKFLEDFGPGAAEGGSETGSPAEPQGQGSGNEPPPAGEEEKPSDPVDDFMLRRPVAMASLFNGAAAGTDGGAEANRPASTVEDAKKIIAAGRQ